MTDEERKEELARMHRCLDLAADIWTRIGDEMDQGGSAIQITVVTEIVRKHFPAPLVKRRVDALGTVLADTINEHSLTSCGLWTLAHMLNHILFDEDMSVFDEVS